MTSLSCARVGIVLASFIGSHAHRINRGNRTGKADGGDAIRRDGHGDDNPLVERDALNRFGRFSEGGSCGQQEDVNG